MFEREIKFITDFSLNHIKKLGSFFTLENLAAAQVHPAITQYVSAEIDYLIYRDRHRLLQKSDFDYSGAEIAKHFEAIAAEIKINKLIPFEDVKMRVQRAVNFNVNLLLRPHWTLRNFIFDNEDSHTADEVRLLMNYTYFYDYYKQYFQRVTERKKILSFGSSEFSERLRAFRKELIASQFEPFIDDFLSASAEFLNMGETSKDRLAIGAVEAFLKDSELNSLISRVHQQFSTDPKQKFSVDVIKESLLSDTPFVRTVEFGDNDNAELSSLEFIPAEEQTYTSVESLFLEAPAKLDDEEITLPAVEMESKDELGISEEDEIDVSIQITELLTNQLLTEEKNPDTDNENRTIGGIPAESLIAEIKAAQNAISAISSKPTNNSEEEHTESEIEPEENKEILSDEAIIEPDTEEEVFDDSLSVDFSIDLSAFEISSPDDNLLANNHFPEEPPVFDDDLNEEIIAEAAESHGNNHFPEEPPVFDDDLNEEIIAEAAESHDNNEFELPSTIETEINQAAESNVSVEPNSDNAEPAATIEPEEEESELFRYFTTKETMRIISNVFGNDQIDFVTTIEKIANFKLFEHASLVLKEVFYAYNVNPFSNKEALLLEDRIKKYFAEQEHQ